MKKEENKRYTQKDTKKERKKDEERERGGEMERKTIQPLIARTDARVKRR